VNRFFSYYFSDDHFGHWREKQRREKMENICKKILSSTNEQKQLSLEGRHSGKTIKVNCWNFSLPFELILILNLILNFALNYFILREANSKPPKLGHCKKQISFSFTL